MKNDLPMLSPGPELRQRRTTSDYIAEALRDAIYSGSLPDGAVLNQVTIAERFGVSRVPVREAMRQLQAEGLISAAAHRRAVVRSLSIDRVVEIYDLRAMVESYLVGKAVSRIDRDTLERLRAIERSMDGVTDPALWMKRNADLHRTLYRPSGAVTALHLAEQLRGRAERYLHLWNPGQGLGRSDEAAREHRDIIDRVAAEDADGAREAIERHVAHTRDRVLELYGMRDR